MIVKELIEILTKFDKNQIVKVDSYGEMIRSDIHNIYLDKEIERKFVILEID